MLSTMFRVLLHKACPMGSKNTNTMSHNYANHRIDSFMSKG